MSNLQALEIFLNTPVNQQMIHFLVNNTLRVLPSCVQDTYPTPPASPTGTVPQLPSLFTFISRLVKYTNVFTGTLMATLVYLKKLHEKLPQGATAQDPSSRHRIFLACLILSAKFHNDASPKNKHWSKYTDGLFETFEINEMERQLLFLLDWDITITNHDLMYVLKDFLIPIKKELKNMMKLKTFLKTQAQAHNSPEREIRMSQSKSLAARSLSTHGTHNLAKSESQQQMVKKLKKFPSLPQLPSQRINYNSVSYIRSVQQQTCASGYDSTSLNSSSTLNSLSTCSSSTSSEASSVLTSPEDEFFAPQTLPNEFKVKKYKPIVPTMAYDCPVISEYGY